MCARPTPTPRDNRPRLNVYNWSSYVDPAAIARFESERQVRILLLVLEADAGLLLVINASPYQLHKQAERESIARARVQEVGLPLAYVHMLGGQDELIFEGNSFVMDASGAVVQLGPARSP